MLAMIADDPTLADTPIVNQPYVLAEFIYSVRFEMAESLLDLLTRRTRAHLHDARATLAAAPRIAQIVASDFAWSDEQTRAQVAAYAELVAREFAAAGLSEGLSS